MKAGWRRRDLLVGGVALGLGGAAAIWFETSGRADLHLRADELLARLPAAARRGAAALGRRYLAQHPEESDPDRLRRYVGEAVADGSAPRLRDRIRSEFARGELVAVDGWQITRTEARLCALAALAEPQPRPDRRRALRPDRRLD